MRKLILVGAALVPLWSAPLAQGVVILSDTFTYPDGSLVGAADSPWVHHSGTVTGEVKVVSGRAFLSQTNGEDVSAPLLGQPYAPAGNAVLYASFVVNFQSLPTGTSDYFAHFKTGGISGFAGKIYATTNGVTPGFFRLGIANSANTPSVLINSNLTLNTDYLLVTRLAVSNASSTLWLSPATESDPGVTATDPGTTITVTTYALRETSGIGSLFLDNLIVGTNFSDVVASTGPPAITSQPQSQAVLEGSNATLTVFATGAQPLSYQWLFYSTNLPGATNASLLLPNISTNQAGPYQVVITNSLGATNSDTANLTVNPDFAPPFITAEPQDQIVTEGASVSFNVDATGKAPLSFQWQFNGTDVPNATNSTLTLLGVTTNQAGNYSVTITNVAGTTNSFPAVLEVNSAALAAFAYVTYNMKGNGATNWSTNSPQVQAIGREIRYLNPDVITFNEVPNTYTYEMTNFVAAFLPGYHLAINSATDGFIRSAVLSRFPIGFSKSYLHSADLSIYGYTNSDFTRDLFQAQVIVPAFPQPLNVFVVHLKSGQDTDSSNRRGAETLAISNFLATVFLATNANQPYVLSGDMNEDIDNPPPSHPQSIQHLVNSATGLQLTSPLNPFTSTNLTFSIQSTNGLSHRYDYIMPSPLLFSNITSSQVFRTDLLPNPPPPLLATDDATASDHLPVYMVFANPYAKPFRLLSLNRTGNSVAMTWQSVLGQPYRLEASSNLVSWNAVAQNLMATGATFSFSTNVGADAQFFRVYRQP